MYIRVYYSIYVLCIHNVIHMRSTFAWLVCVSFKQHLRRSDIRQTSRGCLPLARRRSEMSKSTIARCKKPAVKVPGQNRQRPQNLAMSLRTSKRVAIGYITVTCATRRTWTPGPPNLDDAVISTWMLSGRSLPGDRNSQVRSGKPAPAKNQ